MKVGIILKEKYGFDKQEKVDLFIETYEISETIVNKILNDQYSVLLSYYIHSIASFIGVEYDEVLRWCEYGTVPEKNAALELAIKERFSEKPFAARPVLTKVDIPGAGDKIIFGNQMKTTVGRLNEESENNPDIAITSDHRHLQSLFGVSSISDSSLVSHEVPETKEKTVTISIDLLQRLVDAAYDFHPKNPAADEGQEILNKLEGEKS